MQEDYWANALRAFGYSLGRYIYLLDAVCDYDKDAKKNSYNPLLLMNRKPEEMREALEMLLGGASAAFEKLPLVQDKDILDNILYSGVWLEYRRRQGRKARSWEEENGK